MTFQVVTKPDPMSECTCTSSRKCVKCVLDVVRPPDADPVITLIRKEAQDAADKRA